MNFIIYLSITLFILLIIIILVINNAKKYMSIDSTNLMDISGRIIMDEKYEPSLNEVTNLKNVLDINTKGIYTKYKPPFIQDSIQSGDIVNFGDHTNIVRESKTKTTVTYDINSKAFIMKNDNDFDSYIKITYAPPPLSGTDALCRFNMFINNKPVTNVTSPIYRTGILATNISNQSVVSYITRLVPKSTNTLDIRITELKGSNQHLAYEGYIILEEL